MLLVRLEKLFVFGLLLGIIVVLVYFLLIVW